MNRLSKVLITAASLVAMAGTALAQEPDETGGDGTEASAEGEATVDTGGDAATPAVDATMEADAGVGEVAKNYTLGKGKLTVNLDLLIIKLSFSDGMGNSASFTQQQLALGAAYGVTDKITAGFSYLFPIAGDGTDDNKGKGPLTIFGMFNLAESEKMKVAASADLQIDMCAIGMDGCEVGNKVIHAGLGLKYLVAPKVAVFTGAPYGPIFTIQGPPGQHLAISLEDGNPITFDLPVGAGFQAIPKLYAYVMTNLATFRLKKVDGDESDTVSVIGSDPDEGGLGIPLIIGGLFSVTPQIDVGLNLIFPSLADAGDLYGITLGGRYNM